jgi:uncharacterized protein YukE
LSFADLAEPTVHLKAPGTPAELKAPTPLQIFNDAGDLVSPTGWAMQVCDWAFGFNPLEKALSVVTGDWEEFAKCAEAWENLSKMCGDLAGNVRSGNKALDATWDGNAADAAFVYFQQLEQDIAKIQESLGDMHGHYMVIARGVWQMAEALKGFISGILDAAAIAAVEAAAGAALSWTGWGAAVGAGLVALEIANMLKLWAQATKAIGDCQGIANGALGLIEVVIAGAAPLLEDFPLPEAAYDNPAAA